MIYGKKVLLVAGIFVVLVVVLMLLMRDQIARDKAQREQEARALQQQQQEQEAARQRKERVRKKYSDVSAYYRAQRHMENDLDTDRSEFHEITDYGVRIKGSFTLNEEADVHHPSVESVFVGSPADQALIAPGDIVHRIDEIPAQNGKERTLRVTLEFGEKMMAMPILQRGVWLPPYDASVKRMRQLLEQRSGLISELRELTKDYYLYDKYFAVKLLKLLEPEEERKIDEVLPKAKNLVERIESNSSASQQLLDTFPQRSVSP